MFMFLYYNAVENTDKRERWNVEPLILIMIRKM